MSTPQWELGVLTHAVTSVEAGGAGSLSYVRPCLKINKQRKKQNPRLRYHLTPARQTPLQKSKASLRRLSRSRCLLPSLVTSLWPLGPTWWKEKVDSCKPSGLLWHTSRKQVRKCVWFCFQVQSFGRCREKGASAHWEFKSKSIQWWWICCLNMEFLQVLGVEPRALHGLVKGSVNELRTQPSSSL